MNETPPGALSSVVKRLERRIHAEAIIGRAIDHFSIGPNEMGSLMGELNVDRPITEFRGIPVLSSRAEGIRTLYRTSPSAPTPQTGRQRAAQIIADEIHRQGKLPEYQGLDAYEVHYPINLGAIVDALVAAAPKPNLLVNRDFEMGATGWERRGSNDRRPDVVIAFREGRKEPEIVSWNQMAVGEHWLYVSEAPPAEQNAYTPPETLTEVSKLWELRDPFDGSVTRIESWPEGLVLWYDGQIAWRSWGPPAIRPEHAPPSVKIPVRVTLKEGEKGVLNKMDFVPMVGRENEEFYHAHGPFMSNVEPGFVIDEASNTIRRKNLVLGMRSVMAIDKPFGTDLIYWCGRIDTPDGEESRANAHHYRAAKSPYRGGNSFPDHRADNGELPHPSTGERP